ncbi:MAG: ribosomal-protein-alanine N-acetyltransferase [Flavobacteriales bacterium]|jgi:ribosomal-protein-alanine N-acetyltransferase
MTFSISNYKTSEKIGSIAIKFTDRIARIAEVGFMIKEDSQRKGFGGEALELVKDYAFGALEVNKLLAICSINNTGSCRLLEKLGFSREGCLRQNTFIGDKYVDDYFYGLCNSDI